MLKTIPAVALLLLLVHPLCAQKVPGEFGTVGKDVLDMTAYEKDPDAEAVILFDVGESVFFDKDGGYDIRFTRTKRIKILTRAGLDQAEVSIPFYVDGDGKTERIVSIEAYSYTFENGGYFKKALDQQKVYEERVNDRWRAKKFAFPNVKEGSAIEYKYVLETPFHFNLPDWQFQDRIPTVYSQYTAKMIPFYEYHFIAQGIKKFDFQESKVGQVDRIFGSYSESYGANVGTGVKFKDMIHTYVVKDSPAFKDEAYITSPNDYLAKLDFQLAKFHHLRGGSTDIITTWPELTKALLKHEKFGRYTNSAERIAKKLLATELQLGQENNLEKSKQIIEYVKANFSWNGYYGRYASKSPKELLNQKTGNAADINLFLTALLNAAGIPAHPVLISTRDHGKIKANYPFEHFFNYVLVMVAIENQSFLADGTEEMIAYNKIPPRCINEKGLVIRKEEVNWVDLYSNAQSLENKTIILKPDAKSLLASITVMTQSTEFEALNYRNLFKNDSSKIKEFLLNNGFKQVSHVKTLNFEKVGMPYVMSYAGETAIERIDNKLIVSPFLQFPIRENKLTQKKRAYPVDFIYSKKETFRSIIDIPEGYKVLSMPEAYVLDNELAEISLKYQLINNTVEANATYHFKKSMYVSEEYARIQHYFDMIVKKFNEQLVFEEI